MLSYVKPYIPLVAVLVGVCAIAVGATETAAACAVAFAASLPRVARKVVLIASGKLLIGLLLTIAELGGVIFRRAFRALPELQRIVASARA